VPDDTRPALDNLYVAPRNLIEEKLAKIWAEVLELKQVGICDTFSDLGGHSLHATQVISRIVAEFKVELPIDFLLNSPTISEMAAVVANSQAMPSDDIVVI
jgi:acyl carrier protein